MQTSKPLNLRGLVDMKDRGSDLAVVDMAVSFDVDFPIVSDGGAEGAAGVDDELMTRDAGRPGARNCRRSFERDFLVFGGGDDDDDGAAAAVEIFVVLLGDDVELPPPPPPPPRA